MPSRCREHSRVGDTAANHRPPTAVGSADPDWRYAPRQRGRARSTWQGRSLVTGVVILAGFLTGCGGPGEPPARTAEAEASARNVADQIVADLRTRTTPRTRTADEIGRALAARAEADLVAISGVDTGQPGGVTAVLRVAGSGTDGTWLQPEWVVEDFCFELRFTATSSLSPRTVPCPSPAAGPTFPPVPVPTVPSPEELRATLSATAADESAVRAALAELSRDPTIRVDVAAQDATVGVALRYPAGDDGRYGCIFARTRTGAVEVWQPTGVQLLPGELTCRATESLAGHGRQPPR
ncbi:hypothetical protein [Micromonospora sp. NPDC023956]|uniref:hypothetical protein n=1 Tax=Micromonospora sp. NPDC023956 TaxID=3155722 RepID=UPI00340F4C61